MGWAEWMIVNQSLEEELELERNVRDVQGCTDGDADGDTEGCAEGCADGCALG